MWRETIKLRLAWSLLFILWGKFSAMVNHYAVEHDLQKYSRALCASVPLLYWKIMALYPIKNCIKSLKYYMHFTGISLIRLFCMCRCWQHTEKGSFDWLLPFKSSPGVQDLYGYGRCMHAFTLKNGIFVTEIFNLGQISDEGRSLKLKQMKKSSKWKNSNISDSAFCHDPLNFFNNSLSDFCRSFI